MFFGLIILGSTDKRAPQGSAPIANGLGLTLIHLISIPVTNTSVNPARRLGGQAALALLARAHMWVHCSARSPTAPSRARTPEGEESDLDPGRAALKTLACAAACSLRWSRETRGDGYSWIQRGRAGPQAVNQGGGRAAHADRSTQADGQADGCPGMLG